jgi:hemoglobin-like flavoprotein
MGGVPAFFQTQNDHRTLDEIVLLIMPSYYISDAVSARETKVCQKTWNFILGDTSPVFLENLSNPDFIAFQQKHGTKCLDWFVFIFFERLFDVHPTCRPLFRDTSHLKMPLSKMISFALSQTRDQKKFRSLMRNLAIRHCRRGIQAVEYGIMGSVLFYTLEVCLGLEQYNTIADNSWKIVFSSMLRCIVPECVKYSIEQKKEDKRLEKLHSVEIARFLDRVSSASKNNSLHSRIESGVSQDSYFVDDPQNHQLSGIQRYIVQGTGEESDRNAPSPAVEEIEEGNMNEPNPFIGYMQS